MFEKAPFLEAMGNPEADIRPGQIFKAKIEGSDPESWMEVKVQIMPGDDRVILSPLNNKRRASKRHPFITSLEVLLQGGTVDGGSLGRLIFYPVEDDPEQLNETK